MSMGATAGDVVPTNEERGIVVSEAITEASQPLIARFAGRKPQARLTDEQKEAILTLLAMHSGSARKVERLLGYNVSHQAIIDVKYEFQVAFADKRDLWKKAASVESQRVFELATDIVQEKLPLASARDAAVVAGIYGDKSALFAGDAVVVHHIHSLNPSQIAALAGDAARLRSIVVSAEEGPGEVMEAEFEVIE